MIKVFYDPQNGRISHTLETEDAKLLALQEGPWIEVESFSGDVAEHRVAGSFLVPLPPRPSAQAEFDYDTGLWVDPRSLDQIRDAAKVRLNAWVATERAKYITVLPGQEMIYPAKEAEAIRYVADPDPVLTQYPFLSGEIGITAPDAYQIAQIWLHMSALWRSVAAQLEAIRLGLSASIDSAETAAEIEALLATLSPTA